MTKRVLIMALVVVGVAMSVNAAMVPSMALIDQAGNADDVAPMYGYVKTPQGGVAYDYYLSKTEITVANYTQYLNAAAGVGDVHGLYTANMAYSVSGPQQIAQVGDTYVANAGWDNRPAGYMSYNAAARYCNYLTSGDTEVGVYTFRDSVMGPIVNEAVKTGTAPAYWIPKLDELYKAHFYNADTGTYETYATGSSVVPTNTVDATGNNANFRDGGVQTIGSPYHLTEVGSFGENSWGLSDTGGNVQEWTDEWNWGAWLPNAHFYGPFFHGGSYWSSSPAYMQDDFWNGYHPSGDNYIEWENAANFDMGFRVASNVPEPTTMVLVGMSALALIRRKRNK